ncbi:MAG: hypothetical protein J6Y24_05765 [Bacteroidales bacterium]|nr:hypothetical protein [Bacteroidales bacterium]
MQTTEYNQLATCADYLNGFGCPSPDELSRLSDDDEFAMSASDIAEISLQAHKQLHKDRTIISIIPLIAIAAAAVLAVVMFIPQSANDSTNTTAALKTSVLSSSHSDEILAQDGIAVVSWDFEAQNSDTLVIYDLSGTPLIKKEISGRSATVALPATGDKFSFAIERNATEILKKGTIKAR